MIQQWRCSYRTALATLSVAALLCVSATRTAAECTLGCNAYVTTFANAGEGVYFSGSSTPSGCSGTPVYDWDFGDGSPHSSEAYLYHSYDVGGTFTWTLVVTADGKSCTKTGTISVCGLACDATVPATSRVGAPVSFQGSATATSCLSFNQYDWDFGDGSSHGTWSTPQHAYANPGTYTWTLTVTNFTKSCSKSGTITIGAAVACSEVFVSAPSAGEVAADVNVESHMLPADCAGTPSYLFDFGDKFVAYWGTGYHRYCKSGTYQWTATATVNGVPFVKTGSIVITPPTSLTCSVSSTQSGLCPLEASFTGYTHGCESQSTYLWDFGGVTSASRETKHSYPQQGTFDWSMTTWLEGFPCTVTGAVTVNKPASITAVATAAPHGGTGPVGVTFTAGSEPASCIEGATYLWTFGDGSTSSEQSPTHIFANPGFYTWVMTATSQGLTARKRGAIVVGSGRPPYTWAPQISGTQDNIVDLHFPSENAGWTAAQYGLRATADGARTWSKRSGTWSYAVRFLSPTIGFYTGECGFSRTLDGGANWSGFWYTNCYGFRLTDIFPTSENQAWESDSAGYLWRWTWAPGGGLFGSDWARDFFTSTGVTNLWALWFVDSDNGWGIGNNGRIVRIANGTATTPTFTVQTSGTTSPLLGIVMLSPTNGWVVGGGGTILHTTTGGAVWVPVASGTSLDLYAVDFRDANNGWIVGEGGVVLATGDGGATWHGELSATGDDLRSVSAPSGSFVYAAGLNGSLLKRLSFGCPTITTTPDSLPDAVAHTHYEQALQGSGGDEPYTFGVTAGAPPAGLTLDSSGALSGYPSVAGATTFTARAVDAGFCSGDRAYDLNVRCDLACDAYAYFDALVSPSLTARFLSSTSGSCGAASYSWTFGDGATSTDQNPTHAYPAAGTYSWNVTVSAGGQTCTKSGEVTVAATCTLTCSAIVPTTAPPWADVPFQAAATTTACSGDVTYSWTFGDGSLYSSGQSLTHAYAQPGSFGWELAVRAGGRICTQSGTIEVAFNKRRHLHTGSGPGS